MSANGQWSTVKLGELADFRNGVNYNKSSFGEGIKVVGVKDFQDYTKPKFATLEEINPEGIVTEKNILHDQDIIFVRSNGNRELIGRSLFIQSPPEEVTHSAFTIRCRFTSADVYPRFFAYLFRTPLIRHSLTAHGGGVNIANLNQDILSRLEVQLPDLPTQRKIAGILSAYDDLIENNLRRIRILEDMAQSLYREWFVHFRFPGHENSAMTDSPLGPIPEGWEVKKVKSILKRLKAGEVYKQADVSDVGAVPVIDQSTDEVLGFHDNEPDHNAAIDSPIAIFGDHTCKMQLIVTPFSIGPNVVPFVAQVDRPLVYVYYLVRNLATTQEYKRHWTQLNANEVPVASEPLTARFTQFCQPLLDSIERLKDRNQTLRQTRDLLLPKLLSQ